MKYILTILFLAAISATAQQYKYITFDRTIVRYNANANPWPFCINNECSKIFFNANNDTLSVVHSDGFLDIRVNVNVKDTLASLTIIEPTNVLSATRSLFNGSKVIRFNQANYYVVSTMGRSPYKIYRVSDNALYVEVGLTMDEWHLPMPLPTIITTNIKSYLLP